jgi:signal transduction histidine kinase
MSSFLSFKRKVWSGYIIAFLLLLVSYFLIFYTMRRSIQETDSVTHTYAVINKLELLRTEITEAETGLRGFVITKDDRFLEPYNNAIKNIPFTRAEVKQSVANDKDQKARFDTLEGLLDRRLDIMKEAKVSFVQNDFTITDGMRKRRESTRALMDSIRLYVDRMKSIENSLMVMRKDKLSGLFDNTQVVASISLIIAFITLCYSLIVFTNENKAKEKAIEKTKEKVTELQLSNKELKELKSVEKFTSTGRIARTIAHEVRNPLTNISLAAEQLQEITAGNKDSAVLLDMISRNVVRINQLVSDLLNATRFAQLEFQDADITHLLEETIALARDRIELNNIKVETSYTKEVCVVSVDREKIKLAILNILVNGIEAMEKNTGVLQLITERKGSKCIIEIKDNGKGMDDTVLQNLFEPYFTSKIKGNGLGLTNTQNIIFNHKGSINVVSKPGLGTSFVIVLSLSAQNRGVENQA